MNFKQFFTENVEQIPDDFMVWHLSYIEDPTLEHTSFKELVTTKGMFFTTDDSNIDQQYQNPVSTFTLCFEMEPEKAYQTLKGGNVITYDGMTVEDMDSDYHCYYLTQHGPELHMISQNINKLKMEFINKMIKHEKFLFDNNKCLIKFPGKVWNVEFIKNIYNKEFNSLREG